MLIAHLPVTPCASHRERCRRRANQARIHSPNIGDGTPAGISTPSLASHDVEHDTKAGISGRMSCQAHSLVAHPRPVRTLLARSGRSWVLRASHLPTAKAPCGCDMRWARGSVPTSGTLTIQSPDFEPHRYGKPTARSREGRARGPEPDGPSWTRVDVPVDIQEKV